MPKKLLAIGNRRCDLKGLAVLAKVRKYTLWSKDGHEPGKWQLVAVCGSWGSHDLGFMNHDELSHLPTQFAKSHLKGTRPFK